MDELKVVDKRAANLPAAPKQKYNPTPDDMYSTKPCFICGKDVLDEGTDVCSPECKVMKSLFDADWEYTMSASWEEYEGEEDDWTGYDNYPDEED